SHAARSRFSEPRTVAGFVDGVSACSGLAARLDRHHSSSVNAQPTPSTALTSGHGFADGAGSGADGCAGVGTAWGGGSGSGAEPGFTSSVRAGTDAISQRPRSTSNHGSSAPGSSVSPG